MPDDDKRGEAGPIGEQPSASTHPRVMRESGRLRIQALLKAQDQGNLLGKMAKQFDEEDAAKDANAASGSGHRKGIAYAVRAFFSSIGKKQS